MKNLLAYSFLLLSLFASTSARATSTTYYAKLTVGLSSNSPTGAGKVYASTSSNATSGETSAVGSNSSTGDSASVTVYGFAQANKGFEFKGWSTNTDGSGTLTAGTKYTYAVTSSDKNNPPTNSSVIKTIYAVFDEIKYDPFSITFAAPPAGCSYTVNDAAPADLTNLTKVTTVTLATSDSSFNSWKINDTRIDTNPYTFSTTSDTTVEAEFLTADKVATVTTKDELFAALANPNLLKVQIPSNATITIPKGETATVPSGLNVVNDGRLLVMGTLANGGKISGNGSYALNFIEISQGDVITPANAFASYSSFKYCKTTVSTVTTGTTSGTAPACAQKGAVRFEGATNWVTADCASPAAAVVTVNTSKAINAISSVDGAYDTVAKALNAAYPTPSTAPTATKFVVLLKDAQSIKLADVSALNSKWILSNNTKQMGAGFRVDCATFQFTISSVVASSQVYLVNGTTISHSSGDNAYNSWGKTYVVGCTGTATVRINANSGATSRVEFYDCNAFGVSNNGTGKLLEENKGGGYYVFTTVGACKLPSTTTNVRTVGGSYTTDPTKYCAVGYKGLYNEETKYYDVVEKTVDYNFYIGKETDSGNKYDTLTDAVKAANGQVIKLAQAAGIASAGETIDRAAILDLNGFTLSGPGKVTISSAGDLTIIDTSVGAVGRFAPAVDVSGKLTVAYGTYTGALTLKSGSTATTYNGTFTGAITVNTGATTDFRGGKFTNSIKSYLGEDYQETKSGSYYCIGRKLIGSMAKQGGSSSLDEQFKLVAITDSSLVSAYSSSPTFSASNPSSFFAKAEAESAITPFSSYTIDVVIKCDQKIGYEKIGFNYIMSKELPAEIPANTEYRAFFTVVDQYLGGSQIKLSRFLTEDNFKNALTVGLYSVAAENDGAICEVEFCLYNGNTKVVSLAKNRLTLGARNNVAYRDVNGTPTFYSTLASAVNAASDGDTVVLARESSASVAVSKAITIDTKGFALSGVTAGTGWTKTETDGKVTFEKNVVPEAMVELTTIVGFDLAIKYTLGTAAIGYGDWNVDFEISSDIALDAEDFTLKGSNPQDGESMIDFPAFALEADTPVRILKSVDRQITYAQLVAVTTDYTCAVDNNSEKQANITVKIVLSKEGEDDIVVEGSTFRGTLAKDYGIIISEDGKELVVTGEGSADVAPTFTTKQKRSVEKTVIRDGVENIGKRFFKDFTKLNEVTVGRDVATIGEKAFYKCMSLEKIVIENPDFNVAQLTEAVVYQLMLDESGVPYVYPRIEVVGYEEVLYGKNDLKDDWQKIEGWNRQQTMESTGYHFFQIRLQKSE